MRPPSLNGPGRINGNPAVGAPPAECAPRRIAATSPGPGRSTAPSKTRRPAMRAPGRRSTTTPDRSEFPTTGGTLLNAETLLAFVRITYMPDGIAVKLKTPLGPNDARPASNPVSPDNSSK